MCDETTFTGPAASDLTRRRFGALTLGAGLAFVLPRAANALEIVSSEVDVSTPDGTADCYLAHPREGVHPGVLVWPDARGMRTVYRQMADRLAESGYTVLVLNPYYRGHRGQVLPDGTDPRRGGMDVLRPLLAQLSPETDVTDAIALVGFLDAHPAVDPKRKMGTMGYCLGGPCTVRTAAQFPQRIGAGASFHGVRLVTDDAESPHRLVPKLNAEFLFVIAEDDDARDPAAKETLRSAFAAAGLPAEIEVYAGGLHSFCTADSPVHNPEQAERAWGRMLALFGRALA